VIYSIQFKYQRCVLEVEKFRKDDIIHYSVLNYTTKDYNIFDNKKEFLEFLNKNYPSSLDKLEIVDKIFKEIK